MEYQYWYWYPKLRSSISLRGSRTDSAATTPARVTPFARAIFGTASRESTSMRTLSSRGAAAPVAAPTPVGGPEPHAGTRSASPPSCPLRVPERGFRGPSVTVSSFALLIVAALVAWYAPYTAHPIHLADEHGDHTVTTASLSPIDRAQCSGWRLSRGRWHHGARACQRAERPVAGCDHPDGFDRGWSFAPDVVRQCNARLLDRPRSEHWLRDRHLAFVGDSQTRHVYAAVLRAVASHPENASLDTDEKHRDWEHELVGGGRASFRWAPFLSNVTAVVSDPSFAGEGWLGPPDALVMGATLWHVLHEGSPDSFEEELARLSHILTRPWTSWWESMGLKRGGDPRVAAAVGVGTGNCGGSCGVPRTVAFWANAARVVPEKLKDPRKIAAMTPEAIARYNLAARSERAGMLPSGSLVGALDERRFPESDVLGPHGSPCVPVDMEELTRGCGAACTEDGIHYDETTYDAAAQIILNTLRMSYRR